MNWNQYKFVRKKNQHYQKPSYLDLKIFLAINFSCTFFMLAFPTVKVLFLLIFVRAFPRQFKKRLLEDLQFRRFSRGQKSGKCWEFHRNQGNVKEFWSYVE